MTRRGPVRCSRKRCLVVVVFVAVCLRGGDFDLRLRKGFPAPVVSPGTPITAAMVELGRHLFYDRRLSVNGSQSCASCHKQELAFTDGLARAKGTTGAIHPRSSMSLVNVAYASSLTWANPAMVDLEEQALIPMFGTDPVELGLRGSEQRVLQDLRADALYRLLFPAAFQNEPDPYTIGNVTKAVAAFERSIISTRSPYDRYRYDGDVAAISAAAKRGEILFFSSEKAGCFQCHGGWNFSGAIRYVSRPAPVLEFHNTGLYNLPGPVFYPANDPGLYRHSGLSSDIGKFRAPTLRNIALTAPYMHDGSIATLEEVVDHYAAGGRAPGNPNLSRTIRPLRLSAGEKRDLIEFLHTLTDRELLSDPRWCDPWNR